LQQRLGEVGGRYDSKFASKSVQKEWYTLQNWL